MIPRGDMAIWNFPKCEVGCWSVVLLKPNTHRRRRRDETVLSRRVGVSGVYMNSQLADDDCRRIRRCERSRWPWPSLQFCSQCYRSRIWRNIIMTLHVCKHSNLLCSVIFVNFYIFFQQWRHYVVTCQLSAQEIVNWVTTADGCVHTADATVNSTVSSRRRRRCLLDITLISYTPLRYVNNVAKSSKNVHTSLRTIKCHPKFNLAEGADFVVHSDS